MLVWLAKNIPDRKSICEKENQPPPQPITNRLIGIVSCEIDLKPEMIISHFDFLTREFIRNIGVHVDEIMSIVFASIYEIEPLGGYGMLKTFTVFVILVDARYSDIATHNQPNFSARYARTLSNPIRSCFAVSRSRTVTALSFKVSPSTVMQNGVPHSSMRA